MQEKRSRLCADGKSDVLLAIRTKKPRAKTKATARRCLSAICSFMTMVMGRQMMTTSEKMLKRMVIQ